MNNKFKDISLDTLKCLIRTNFKQKTEKDKDRIKEERKQNRSNIRHLISLHFQIIAVPERERM